MGQDAAADNASEPWKPVDGVPEFDRSVLPADLFENNKMRLRSVNWMDKGVLLPVVDQGPHQTCLSISLCHALEVYRRIHGQGLPSLDPEMFHGCVLGLPFSSHNRDPFNTLVTLRDQGAPKAGSGFSPGKRCADFAPTLIRSGGHSQMSTASLAKDGLTYAPVVALMSAESDLIDVRDFSIYRDKGAEKNYHHAILLVGFDDGEQCWIVQNSLGTGWGEGGFGRIAYGSARILGSALHRCYMVI